MTSEPLSIQRKCPLCQTEGAVTICDDILKCHEENCGFEAAYSCPLCETPLSSQMFMENEKGRCFKCHSCQSTVPLMKIKNMIDVGLVVDHEIRCGICAGPTIHKPDMNLAHRCFFYPNCSGQSGLFGEQIDSFTFLDFETTGLEVGKDEIIEVGMLKIDEEGYEHIYQTFVKPTQAISERISGFTGITNDMVKDAPAIAEVIDDMKAFIGDSKLVAHNADFDVPWLIACFILHDITIPDIEVVCTLKWARAQEEPRSSLGALTKKYNIGHQNAHRALADAAATKELFFIFENTKKAPRQDIPMRSYEGGVLKTLQKLQLVPA